MDLSTLAGGVRVDTLGLMQGPRWTPAITAVTVQTFADFFILLRPLFHKARR